MSEIDEATNEKLLQDLAEIVDECRELHLPNSENFIGTLMVDYSQNRHVYVDLLNALQHIKHVGLQRAG